MKGFLLVSSLVLTSSALIPMAFTSLQSSTTQKLVLFHDPKVEASMQKLGVLETLDAAGIYGTEYEYAVCDVTSDENLEVVKGAGITNSPTVFTQTIEGGIEPFPGDLTVESFAAYHKFRKTDVTEDNVIRMKDSDGKGEVDGARAMLAIASQRPVFIKMYEVTYHTP
jgi:hypothetical protein